MVINMVFFGKFNQFDQKGRDYYVVSGMDVLDSVLLQFGNVVFYMGYFYVQFMGFYIVGEVCYEMFVYGGYQLQYILFVVFGGGE